MEEIHVWDDYLIHIPNKSWGHWPLREDTPEDIKKAHHDYWKKKREQMEKAIREGKRIHKSI